MHQFQQLASSTPVLQCRTYYLNLGSNEITAIPKLLKLLDVKDCLISIDAMGCQKEIVKSILKGKGNYLLAVKGNQERLYKAVKEALS
ncbi:ISAs1 family transposase [Marinomonas mediterranea]|uniref:ISAs1 family transposase n=1 Tax=Marinomonas mediterranea TaxID=119864 RepID=UPI003085100F|nr:ISAs1 family transposase [Marinomonas mediterranea]